MSADYLRMERINSSLRSSLALLAALTAFIASPVLIAHLCYLTSPAIEVILILVIPLALGIAVFVARRFRTRLLILIMAPVLNFGHTTTYHEWLHMDAFPSVLLGRDARERRIELNERDEMELREYRSAEQGVDDQHAARRE